MIKPYTLNSFHSYCHSFYLHTILFYVLTVCSINLYFTATWADVGTPCESLDDCEPGEICIPDRLQTAQFCSKRCQPQVADSCPMDFICEDANGIYLCNTTMVVGGALGEPCDNGCQAGLLCVNDGQNDYCSQTCTGLGSCPAGYRCNLGQNNFCTRAGEEAGLGESCNERMCAEPLSCINGEERQLPYCSYECRDRACPDFMRCASDAWCRHENTERVLGDACVTEAEDQATVGCSTDLFCYQDTLRAWCTQACDRENPCPDTAGCIVPPIMMSSLDPQQGICDLNVDTDAVFLDDPNTGNFEDNSSPRMPEIMGEAEEMNEQEGASCQGMASYAHPMFFMIFMIFVIRVRLSKDL